MRAAAADKYLAMLSPLKKRAMSWSEDCQGSPLALITVLSHTFSILLLQGRTNRRGAGCYRRQKIEADCNQTLLTKCLFQISR